MSTNKMREALEVLLRRDEANTCQHDETYRGGVIWEICRQCGAKWADDKGGKPEWVDPPEWLAAHEAIAADDAARGTMRDQFEAWAKEYGRIFLNRLPQPPGLACGEVYEHQFTQEAWVGFQAGWQASRAAASQASSPLGRDADWVLAMAGALGTDSGFSVPIVPEPDAFRALFAAVRAAAPQTGHASVEQWEAVLSAVMPADFKDWHENSPVEWPEVAAGVIVSLRADRDAAWNAAPQGEVVVTKNKSGQIVCVTRQDADGQILSVIAEAAAPQSVEPKKKCGVCGGSGVVEQYTSATAPRAKAPCPFCNGGVSGSWCPTPEGCGPHGCHGACLPQSVEPAAHMYPSDLARFATAETTATAFSVAVGCPDERSVPLYLAPPIAPTRPAQAEEIAFAKLRAAALEVLSWIEAAHRPPVRDPVETGRMVLVRLHALADLHATMSAPPTKTKEQP